MSSDTKSTVRRPKRPDWSSLKAAKRKELNHRWDMLLRYGMEQRPCMLGPPAAFSAELAPLNPGHSFWPKVDRARTGKRSGTVAFRLGMSCAGWNQQPTTEEFHEAVHAQSPTERPANARLHMGARSYSVRADPRMGGTGLQLAHTGDGSRESGLRHLSPDQADQRLRDNRRDRRNPDLGRLTKRDERNGEQRSNKGNKWRFENGIGRTEHSDRPTLRLRPNRTGPPFALSPEPGVAQLAPQVRPKKGRENVSWSIG